MKTELKNAIVTLINLSGLEKTSVNIWNAVKDVRDSTTLGHIYKDCSFDEIHEAVDAVKTEFGF